MAIHPGILLDGGTILFMKYRSVTEPLLRLR